jgi:hypothetical protein
MSRKITHNYKKGTIQIIDIKIDFVTLKNGKKSSHTG